MKLNCCYLTIFYQQVKKIATTAILVDFCLHKSLHEWETHLTLLQPKNTRSLQKTFLKRLDRIRAITV